MDAGRVVVTASSQWIGLLNRVVDREAHIFCTHVYPDSWIAINLGAVNAIRPTHYTLRHDMSDSDVLRHWVLEASVDGTAWEVLRTHVDDQSIEVEPGATASWLLTANRAYYHFRVRQTDKNSDHYDNLSLSGFEIYGQTNLP